MEYELEPVLESLKAGYQILKNPAHWIRGEYSNGHGRYCLLGACGYWTRKGVDNGCVKDALKFAIHSLYPDAPEVATVSRFNDTHEYSEVIEVLKLAIEIEKLRAA